MRRGFSSQSICLLVCWTVLLAGCSKVYFISDPYWEMATELSKGKLWFTSLLKGVSLKVKEPVSWEEIRPSLDTWLQEGRKVIVSPYWHTDLENAAGIPEGGQLIELIDVPSKPFVQIISLDRSSSFREIGKISAEYIACDLDRDRVVAFFYSSVSYNDLVDSFTRGFAEVNPDSDSLYLRRFYLSEYGLLEYELEQFDFSRILLVMALSDMGLELHERFADVGNALLIVEEGIVNQKIAPNILLSIDTDYRQMFAEALKLPPRPEGENEIEVPMKLVWHDKKRYSQYCRGGGE